MLQFGPPVANSAADIQMIVNATQLNIAALKEDGFDFNIQYDTNVSDWDLGVFARGTYLFNYKTQSAPGLPFESQLGKYSSFGSPVKLRSQMGVHFGKDWFGGAFTANYVKGYECGAGNCFVPGVGGAPIINVDPVKIDPWWTIDAAFDFDLSGLGGFMSGTSAVVTVNNIFDNDAPFIDGGSPNSSIHTAYDPANHTIIGRTVGLLIRKRW